MGGGVLYSNTKKKRKPQEGVHNLRGGILIALVRVLSFALSLFSAPAGAPLLGRHRANRGSSESCLDRRGVYNKPMDLLVSVDSEGKPAKRIGGIITFPEDEFFFRKMRQMGTIPPPSSVVPTTLPSTLTSSYRTETIVKSWFNTDQKLQTSSLPIFVGCSSFHNI